MLKQAENISAWLDPPRWRVLAHWRWRHHQQWDDIFGLLWRSLYATEITVWDHDYPSSTNRKENKT